MISSEFDPQQKRQIQPEDIKLFGRVIAFSIPYWPDALISVLFLILLSVVEALGPYLLKLAIDGPIIQGNFSGLLTISLVYLMAAVVGYWASIRQSIRTERLGQKIMADIRSQLFIHIQKLSPRFFDSNPSGRLMTRVIGDVDVIQELFTSGLVAVIGDFFTLLSITIAMLLLDLKLALIPLGLMPVVLMVSFIYKGYARSAYRMIRVYLSQLNGYMAENVNGISTVHLNNSEKRNFEKYEKINHKYKVEMLKSIHYNAVFYPIVQWINALAIAMVLGFGSQRVLTLGIGIGVIVAFLQYVQRFFQPIHDLAEKYNIFQSAMASSERIFQLLDTQPDIVAPERPTPLNGVRGDIEFSHVHFSYHRGESILEDVSFKVRAGERVAIVGSTGAGKTTIGNILLRFYNFDQGKVYLDGIDILQVDLKELRRNIVLIPQDVFLFQGTIAENISLENPRITDKEIRKVLKDISADSFFKKFPMGLDQPVGERGRQLSTGERQLVAFVRAMILNPPVLLLDEATSSVDTEMELLLQRALLQLMANRTCLIIAHRLSTLNIVDRILKVDNRKIIGTQRTGAPIEV